MKKHIFTAVFLFLLCSCLIYSQPNWVAQTSGTNNLLTSCYFFDENTGWIAGGLPGQGTILKTTNGGAIWSLVFTGGQWSNLYSIHFINSITGWSCGAYGYLVKTTNGGLNWFNQTTYNEGDNRSVYFTNQNSGYIVGSSTITGYGLRIMRSVDGGNNWQNIYPGYYYRLQSVFFVNQNTGWAVGDSSVILKTINAGLNWFIQYGDLNYTLNSIFFVNENTGWAVGGYWAGINSIIRKTTNGGTNWINQYCNDCFPLNGVHFVDSNTGWAVGGGGRVIPSDTGTIIKSTNGGNNWEIQLLETSARLQYVKFVNHNTGWAVGDHGFILKTTNGGEPVGIHPISTQVSNDYSLAQNYPNPFNPTTKIKYSIPLSRGVDAEGGRGVSVSLIIYDNLGREIATLVNERLSPGTYEVEWDGTNYPSGVYFYKLITDNYSETRKMVLVK